MEILLGFAVLLVLATVAASLAFAARDSEHGTDHGAEDFLDRDDPIGRDD